MFGRKKQAENPTLVTNVIKNLQGDTSLYTFGRVFISSEYRFAIAFPESPTQHELDDGIGKIHQSATPDSIVYSVLAYHVEDEPDKNAIVNDIMDGITDTPNWKEYSNRETTTVAKGHTALTQTFISDDNTLLINTTLFTDKYIYSIQVQNVYLEHAVNKLASFIDTFKLLPDRDTTQ